MQRQTWYVPSMIHKKAEKRECKSRPMYKAVNRMQQWQLTTTSQHKQTKMKWKWKRQTMGDKKVLAAAASAAQMSWKMNDENAVSAECWMQFNANNSTSFSCNSTKSCQWTRTRPWLYEHWIWKEKNNSVRPEMERKIYRVESRCQLTTNKKIMNTRLLCASASMYIDSTPPSSLRPLPQSLSVRLELLISYSPLFARMLALEWPALTETSRYLSCRWCCLLTLWFDYERESERDATQTRHNTIIFLNFIPDTFWCSHVVLISSDETWPLWYGRVTVGINSNSEFVIIKLGNGERASAERIRYVKVTTKDSNELVQQNASSRLNNEIINSFSNLHLAGPAFWGLINPQWNMCSKGRRQSPINVEPEKLLFDPYLRPLHIDKHKVSAACWFSILNHQFIGLKGISFARKLASIVTHPYSVHMEQIE